MVNYQIKEVGESSFEIEWLGKRPKLNMTNLQKMYEGMEFISTCGKSKQCEQFGKDLKKALQNDLGAEYNVEISIGHFYISGFISKNGKYVYFNVEDLRDNGEEFSHILYRTAKNNKDYTGGTNRFCKLNKLAENIISLIKKEEENGK